MDLAFSDFETEQIYKALLAETRRCAVTLGMRKTSVDQLTQAVGISKGSFYKFFESKELLFFAVLEDIHSELYDVADRALHENVGLPAAERAATAILAVCKRMSDTGVMTRRSCKDFPKISSQSIITMMKRIFALCLNRTHLFRMAEWNWRPLQCVD